MQKVVKKKKKGTHNPFTKHALLVHVGRTSSSTLGTVLGTVRKLNEHLPNE